MWPPPPSCRQARPYAYGLSGFSNVLTTFGTSEGVTGFMGTTMSPWWERM